MNFTIRPLPSPADQPCPVPGCRRPMSHEVCEQGTAIHRACEWHAWVWRRSVDSHLQVPRVAPQYPRGKSVPGRRSSSTGKPRPKPAAPRSGQTTGTSFNPKGPR